MGRAMLAASGRSRFVKLCDRHRAISCPGSKLRHEDAHESQRSQLDSQIVLLYLILQPRRTAPQLTGRDRVCLRLDVTLLKRFRQTSCVSGDHEKTERGHLLQLALCVRFELNVSGCFLRRSHSEVCRCLSSLISQGGGGVS